MNLKQLRAFREVMLTGSVSEAARRLFRTQPTISALITNLEEEIGFNLFERRGGRLHPVPEAQFFLEEAHAIIDRLESTERIAKGIRNLEHGAINIVAMPGPSVFLLPHLISKFLENRSEVKASLFTRRASQVVRLISVQQYDVGLGDVSYPGFSDSPLVNHEMKHLQCLCAIPKNDLLADRDVITAADLDGKPMATLYQEHPNVVQIEDAFKSMGARLNIRIRAQYFIPLLSFVERGLAYAIVDPLSADSYERYCVTGSSVVFRPFLPAVYLIASIMTPAHKPKSHLVEAFIPELRTELELIGNAYEM